MNRRTGAQILTLAAAYLLSSESALSENDPQQGSEEPLSEDAPPLSKAGSSEDKQTPLDAFEEAVEEMVNSIAIAAGTDQLVQGHRNEETAQLAVQKFFGSDDTEWWRCDDSARFIMDDGCGEDGCPVTLAANPAMHLGRVTFAGSESYGRYEIRGLERRWNWCLDDDESFGCAFVLQAGGDGAYYDFNAPSTTTRSDGSAVAKPAGRFTCERFALPVRLPRVGRNHPQ